MDTTELEGRKEEVASKVRELGQVGAAKYYDIKRPTFRDFLYKHNLPTKKGQEYASEAKLLLKPDTAEVTTKASESIPSDNEKIIMDRGLNPDDWEFTGMTDSEWDSPTGETLHSRKITLVRKNGGEFIAPTRTDGPKYEKPVNIPISKDGSLFFVGGDDQAPFHDPYLEEKKLNLFASENFHTIVKIGDTNDFPNISKYKKNPETEEKAQVNNCVQAGYDIMRREREAAPDSRIIKLIGNHDVRLRDFVLATVPELHGLRRAEKDGVLEPSVLSVEFLQRLDELGIELVGDHASYEHGEFQISKYVAARHGWFAAKHSGASAIKTLEHLLYSILTGHTHRLALVHKTVHNINGELTVLAAAETGCLCRVEKDGLGFQPSPDWQQGGATVQVWPDGKFHIDLITYVDGDLIWRGNRY